MYCSQCGSEASGHFCWSCGTPLQGGVSTRFTGDWSELSDYEVLIRIPEVREQIFRCASRATKNMTGEEFLKHCDKILAPLLGGISTARIAGVCQPLYAKLGLASTKTQTELIHAPIGKIIVGLLCSLAERNQRLTKVTQMQDGCVLEASVPSDMYSFAGELTVYVKRHNEGTEVRATAVIKGQKFDWGKSGRCLERLFTDLSSRAQAA